MSGDFYEFEEKDFEGISKRVEVGIITKFFIRIGLGRDQRQAQGFVLIVAFFFFSLSFLIMMF